jgi:DNA-binding transcriptional LysR family regulator
MNARRPELDLRQLYAFVVLAEELHFGRAAARLGIAQPPLSQQIQRLEQRIGHKLLDRGKGRSKLTAAGQAILLAARQALSDIDIGLDNARLAAKGRTGLLRVGFTPSAAFTVMPPVVREFRSLYPQVALHLLEASSIAQLEMIESGHLDVGFLRDLTISDAEFGNLSVLREPFIALLPKAHKLAASNRVPLPALAAEPFVVVRADAGPSFHAKFMALCGDAGFVPSVTQEVGGWATVAGLVSAGLGVALAPASVAQIRLPGMVCRPLAGQAEPSTVMLSWRSSGCGPVLENFIAIVRRGTSERGGRRRGWP